MQSTRQEHLLQLTSAQETKPQATSFSSHATCNLASIKRSLSVCSPSQTSLPPPLSLSLYQSSTMSEQQQQQRPMAQKLYQSTPDARQVVKCLTATTIGSILLVLSGLTLTGTVICLVVATPVLVLFSPILVPAAIAIFLVASGFLFSGGCGVAAISAVSWLYNYVSGKRPPGAEQLDKAREKIAGAAKDMKERAKEYGQYVQYKAQEVAQV